MLEAFAQFAGPPQNTLLASIGRGEWDRLRRHLQQVFMPLGESLNEPGVWLEHVFFPVTSIVSHLGVTAERPEVQIAMVGNEGLVGVSALIGDGAAADRAVVKSGGWGYRLQSQRLKEEFARGGAMQQLLLRYTRVFLTQVAQTAICNRHHAIEQQFCRWLLSSFDRLASEELQATHELIANMLGVRRESVTQAAVRLANIGLIHSSHGHVTVDNRAGLEARCCECYIVVRREFDRLLGQAVGPVSKALFSTDVAAVRQRPGAARRGPALQNRTRRSDTLCTGDASRIRA